MAYIFGGDANCCRFDHMDLQRLMDEKAKTDKHLGLTHGHCCCHSTGGWVVLAVAVLQL